MTPPAISIIIPAHNASDTLDSCICSVQAQDFKDWELIVVDNCSTDKTIDIVERYSSEDSRIFLVNEKEKGVSNARNTGLKYAKGAYVCFIDADDTIATDYLSSLYSKREYDMVVCGYCVEYTDTNSSHFEICQPSAVSGQLAEIRKLLVPIFEKGFMHFCWNKLFKLSIIKDRNLTFLSIPVNEDFIFVLEYLKYTQSICVLIGPLYRWIRVVGKDTGVKSIPDNLLSIYNHSHLLCRDFFNDNSVSDRIAYFSYEMLIYKYYEAQANGKLSRKEVFGKLKDFTHNSLVKDAYSAYLPDSRGEYILYSLMKYGLYKVHYYTYNKLLRRL